MSSDTEHASYEWADKAFEGAPDVEPKYRDLLAMLAAAMMGNRGEAQHFYNRAILDGASDAELHRMAEIARAQNIEIGDLTANAKQAAEEIRAEREPPDDAETKPKGDYPAPCHFERSEKSQSMGGEISRRKNRSSK